MVLSPQLNFCDNFRITGVSTTAQNYSGSRLWTPPSSVLQLLPEVAVHLPPHALSDILTFFVCPNHLKQSWRRSLAQFWVDSWKLLRRLCRTAKMLSLHQRWKSTPQLQRSCFQHQWSHITLSTWEIFQRCSKVSLWLHLKTARLPKRLQDFGSTRQCDVSVIVWLIRKIKGGSQKKFAHCSPGNLRWAGDTKICLKMEIASCLETFSVPELVRTTWKSPRLQTSDVSWLTTWTTTTQTLATLWISSFLMMLFDTLHELHVFWVNQEGMLCLLVLVVLVSNHSQNLLAPWLTISACRLNWQGAMATLISKSTSRI